MEMKVGSSGGGTYSCAASGCECEAHVINALSLSPARAWGGGGGSSGGWFGQADFSFERISSHQAVRNLCQQFVGFSYCQGHTSVISTSSVFSLFSCCLLGCCLGGGGAARTCRGQAEMKNGTLTLRTLIFIKKKKIIEKD